MCFVQAVRSKVKHTLGVISLVSCTGVYVSLCVPFLNHFERLFSLSKSGRKAEASRVSNIYKFCEIGQLAKWMFYSDLSN